MGARRRGAAIASVGVRNPLSHLELGSGLHLLL